MSNPLRGAKKRILEFIPNGLRYLEYPVTRETPISAIVKTSNEETARLYKLGHAWTGEKDIMWTAVEGHIFSANIVDNEDREYRTLGELIEDVWPKGSVDRLPEELQHPLKSKWLATVTVEPVEIHTDAKPAVDKLKANELLYDSNIRQAGKAGQYEEEKTLKDELFSHIPWMGFAAFAMYFLINMGWL